MRVRAGRRGILRLVASRQSAPLDDVIQHIDLSPGTAGRWLRLAGADELQIATAVPPCRVRATAQHLLSHGTLAEAEALCLLVCETATCDLAVVWLAQPSEAAISS
jgi:hypothetical protein